MSTLSTSTPAAMVPTTAPPTSGNTVSPIVILPALPRPRPRPPRFFFFSTGAVSADAAGTTCVSLAISLSFLRAIGRIRSLFAVAVRRRRLVGWQHALVAPDLDHRVPRGAEAVPIGDGADGRGRARKRRVAEL